MAHPHPLDLLLTAARNCDEAEIIRIVKIGQLIDEYHPVHLEAVVTTVAAENNEGAVNLLIRHGALKNNALEGAAKGGHRALMERLIASGAARCVALLGAARGNKKHLIDQILPNEPYYHHLILDGAARSNLEQLLHQFARSTVMKGWSVKGAAFGKHEFLLEQLLADGNDSDFAVEGAALGNHQALLERLVAAGASQHLAVHGAAQGGHEPLMDQLILQGHRHSRGEAVQGAARGGHEPLVERLIAAGASRDMAVYGATSYGHLVLMDRLISQGASLKSALIGAKYCNYLLDTTQNATRFLIEITNPALRLEFAIEADRANLSGIVKLTPLLPLKILKRPMERYGLTEREALAWYRHRETLQVLLLERFPSERPNDLRLIMARDFIHSHRRVLDLNLGEISRIQQAMRRSYALAGIVTKLRKKGPHAVKKINALESAMTVPQRTDALCQHRHLMLKPKSLLPKSIRTMMARFPEYGNLTALKHWIENYAKFLKKHWNPRQRANGKALITTLEAVCNSVDFQPIATSHEAFATFLNSNQSWQTLISVLETTPHWKEIGKLFEMAVPAKPERVITV